VTTPIRLIAIDLDGTLLNSGSEISPANRQALVNAVERGVQPVIVTGRRFHSAARFLAQIPCPVTVISSNGARITDPSGEVRHRNFLPRRIARQVLKAAQDYSPYAVVIFDIPGRGQVTMQANAVVDGPLGWYLRNSPDSLARVPDLIEAITSSPIQVMFGGPPDRIESIEPLLRSCPVADAIQPTWTKYPARGVFILDVMKHGCSKGAALTLWASRCQIPPSEVMAIGDNYNDLEMLRVAGHPVLMGNCAAGLDGDGWPVTLSNDEDGVAAAIQRYVLA
jgi:hydroxymethylpyrimidine pyrophosphatase-like HAD family hydrolase